MISRRLKVLVVDDNRTSADALARVLRNAGDDVSAVYDGQSAIDRIGSDPPDVLLTDLRMEPVDGLTVLAAARSRRPPVEVVVFTAYGAVDVAVKAMQLGARDFLTKPVTADQVAERLEAIRSPERTGTDEFVAMSAAARRFREQLDRIAAVPTPVWIEGEIGTGRTFAAFTLHRIARPATPFAVADPYSEEPWPRSGTLVLPEVDTLPEDVQRRVHRHVKSASPDLRVVATSAPGAKQLVVEGRIRPELFYALAVVLLQMPPLRERPEDIGPLFDAALHAFSERYQRPVPVLGDATRAALLTFPWTGNVRELRNLAERAVVMGVDGIAMGGPVADARVSVGPILEPGFSLAAYLEQVEKVILEEALRRAGGDRAEAGRLLGVERNTLRYKLHKYDLL